MTLLLILFITLYIPARKDSLTKKFGNTRVGYLHLTYILIIAFGLYPTAHWISLHGGLENPHVTVQFFHIKRVSFQKSRFRSGCPTFFFSCRSLESPFCSMQRWFLKDSSRVCLSLKKKPVKTSSWRIFRLRGMQSSMVAFACSCGYDLLAWSWHWVVDSLLHATWCVPVSSSHFWCFFQRQQNVVVQNYTISLDSIKFFIQTWYFCGVLWISVYK